MIIGKSRVALWLLVFGLSSLAAAHTINYAMEQQPVTNVFGFYIGLGFQHILPMGLDHILFILALFLTDPTLKSILLQSLCFTIAHSVTLILTAMDILTPDPQIIEPIIALTILFVAIENLLVDKVHKFRYVLILLFGLVHGMGFAGALSETGLPRDAFYSSLIAFNLGVELGQLAVIVLAWVLAIRFFYSKPNYRPRLVYPLAIVIALLSGFWVVERLFFTV